MKRLVSVFTCLPLFQCQSNQTIRLVSHEQRNNIFECSANNIDFWLTISPREYCISVGCFFKKRIGQERHFSGVEGGWNL